MNLPEISIGLARESEIQAIHALMTENLALNGGRLSASFSQDQILAMMRAMPMIIARSKEGVLGFLMTASLEASQNVPILGAMLEAYPGGRGTYVYGPICVAAAARGQGLAQAMFAELCRQLPGREGILFVREDNEASLRAHARMGMREVAGFDFQGCGHRVFAYEGLPTPLA